MADRDVVALEVVVGEVLPVVRVLGDQRALGLEPARCRASRAARAHRRTTRRAAAASASSETNTSPASASTRNAGRRTPSRSSAAKPRASGTAASWPSWRYVQPWYGQRSTFGHVPVPYRICIARWRQTFESARSTPSSPRTTATGSPATLAVANEPGAGDDALGADEDPRAREDVVELGLEDLALDVGARRQRDALVVGDAHARSSPAIAWRTSARARARPMPPSSACCARPSTSAHRRAALAALVHGRIGAGAHELGDLLDPRAVGLLDVRPQRGLIERRAQHLRPDAPALLDRLVVDEVGEHRGLELLARRLAARRPRLDEDVDLLVRVQERPPQELRARVEVVVHERARDAGGARHVAHAHAVAAALGDHAARGTEDIVGAVGDSHLTDSLVKRIGSARVKDVRAGASGELS